MKHLLDAVKTATDIHNGNYSSLRGKSFVTCDKMKKRNGRNKHVKKHKSKYTLNEIGDALFEFIKTTNTRFDNLEKNINDRLDYIVSVNNLKDLPKTKSK